MTVENTIDTSKLAEGLELLATVWGEKWDQQAQLQVAATLVDAQAKAKENEILQQTLKAVGEWVNKAWKGAVVFVAVALVFYMVKKGKK